ncbi:hypothetical protein SAMN05518849_101584 [Sphingobium sp. AP50]|uniref:hypothetical protein n=1 Tax=Sphingobium sp. AP50 TaxID=1884369 RepID=UPI0008C4BADA|nr:hypothetical protein [Sphingobium sp. AP50]SEI69460.1 hypothetical protein SAMN05518849_101584 [Sphingobium sp. AP50]
MSSEGWSVGDLAVCIDDKWTCCGRADCQIKDRAPRKEELLRVRAVDQTRGHLFLGFEGKDARLFFHALQFRKVRPDTEPAEDAEWVEQLQHLRRKQPA